MSRQLSSIALLLRLTFSASPVLAVGEILVVVAVSISGPLQSYGAALLVDASVGRGSLTAASIVLFLALSTVFLGTVLGDAVRHRLEDSIEHSLQSELLRLSTKPLGIRHHEQADIADRLGVTKEQFRSLKGTAGAIASGVTVAVGTGSVLVLLSSVHPLLLTLPLVGMLRLWVSGIGARKSQHAVFRTMRHTRHYKRMMEIARDPRHALEVRTCGARSLFVEEVARFTRLQNGPRWIANRQASLLDIAVHLVFGSIYAMAIVFVLWLASRNDATPGEVALVILLAPQADHAARQLADSVISFVTMLDIVGHVRWLREYVHRERSGSGSGMPPMRLREGIRLENLSFVYPGTEHLALCNVTAFLPAGSTVALVGNNGGGKTTLVKMLAGFYGPTDGKIFVDGIGLDSLDLLAWRDRIAVGFQDFVRYRYTVREAIGLANPHQLAGDEKEDESYNAAIDASDARSVIERLPCGLDTRLGGEFEGIDLSGGQWQRLALARAFLRADPLVTMLDEPAAALDAETEYALVARFNSAARGARENGGILLLVSHRLSTVRMADLVLVFNDGRLVETGSHRELMKARGVYAELFNTQAAGYR
jgi:ATP-binding cassette, subfamily B, bacterial